MAKMYYILLLSFLSFTLCGAARATDSPIPQVKHSLNFSINAESLDSAVSFEDSKVVHAEYVPFVLLLHSFASCISKFFSLATRILVSNGLQDSWLRVFLFLFVFRYLRLVVHIIAYSRSKPKPVLENPTYTAKDVSVIIPTVEPRGAAWEECLDRVLVNGPTQIFVVTVGEGNIREATRYCNALSSCIQVLSVPAPSKREQVKHAVLEVKTPITVLCDDTVFWPATFIPHVLAPFEDPAVGIVGTCKRVRRAFGSFGMSDFWNLCGVFRLERTNFDLASTNAVDGGVSCVSGRTCAVRSSILKDESFLHAYCNEYIFAGRIGRAIFGGPIGPRNASDDKMLTCWCLKKGWKVFHQNCPEVRIETILGVKGGGSRFRCQCIRWARTSAYDNPKMIFEDGLWRKYPWTTYAVLATSIVNYAAIYDPVLVFTLYKALQSPVTNELGGSRHPLAILCFWILATKFVRPASHYWRHPRDLKYVPFIIMFGYYHSWIKFYALLTCWDISWGTRPGIDAAAKGPKAR
ncbi:hypothetical protein SLS57_003823 [Botryosphaeria dothidea]